MLILFLLIINKINCLSKNSLKINVVYIINLFIFAASIDLNNKCLTLNIKHHGRKNRKKRGNDSGKKPFSHHRNP